MRLSDKEIVDILSSKGLTCSNLEEYQNMDTILHLTCKEGHRIDASLRAVRNANFRCTVCDGNQSIGDKVGGLTPPEKTGYRVIALDNATENAGLSIFDNGKLVFYHLFHFEGETITRMLKNRKLFEEVIIPQWKPDMVVVEDIQYQNGNVMTFKALAMLLGSTLVTLRAHNIKHSMVLSKVWRAHFMIGGKTRIEQKKGAITKVKEMYGIEVCDDVAEAILLGKYSVDMLKKETVKKLF